MNVGEKISKAIKEAKWLSILYNNQKGEETSYWIAIKDIDFDKKSFFVSMFNDKISLQSLDGPIYYDKIVSAEVIDFTSYERPDELVNKIEQNLSKILIPCIKLYKIEYLD